MNPSKRVLVTYYSLTGNTARVAKDLASRLDAQTESIQDSRHGFGMLRQFTAALDAWRELRTNIGGLQHNPAQYEVTVVGTPVWMWRMTPAIRSYLAATRAQVHHIAFFVTSGDTDIKKIAPSLEAAAGRKAIALAGFNAHELADRVIYERKLAAFVEEIKAASQSVQRVA